MRESDESSRTMKFHRTVHGMYAYAGFVRQLPVSVAIPKKPPLSLKNVRSRMNSGVSGFLKRVRLVRDSKRTYDPCFVPLR